MNSNESYNSQNIRNHRNIVWLMVLSPLVTFMLALGIFVNSNRNVPTSAAVACNQTITSGSISSAVNALSSGQTLCLSGTFNQSVSISKAGVTLASTPGQMARINGRLQINQGANNVSIMNLYLNGNGIIESPRIVANNAYFYGNYVTNQGATRGICFAIGEITYDVFEVQGITIDNNHIFRCGTVYHDQGIYAENVRNAVIRNNYIYDNPDFAIQFYPSAQNSLFENNIVDGNARGITFSSDGSKTSSGNLVRNNIITNSPDAYNLNYYWGGPAGTGNRAEGNCLFNGGKGNIQSGLTNYVTVTGTIQVDPLYVDRANKDFRLKAGSPCAGKGPQVSSSTSPSTPPPPPKPPPNPAPSPLPTPTPIPVPSLSGPNANYFGKNSVGDSWTSMSADAKRGSRYTYSGPVGQQLYQVGGFLRGSSTVSGSQVVNVAVYSDNNGAPGNILSKGLTDRTVSSGQAASRFDFTLQTPLTINPGTSFWLLFTSGQSPGVAEYSHVSATGALKWQSEGSDLFSDGPASPAGVMNTDNKAAVIWGLFRSVPSSGNGSSPTESSLPPVSIPGSNPSTPVPIPSDLPQNSDGTYTGDFNNDGLNDIAKDSNNDDKIDPTFEIVVDGSANPSLTDINKSPITPDQLEVFNTDMETAKENAGTITFKAGPLPEVSIAKPVAYTFFVAQGFAISGISAYLAVTKLSLFAGIRRNWRI